jgi:outer membrane autotransporter protein
MQCRALKRRRKSWLLAASALASSSLGISEPALAADECGPLVGGSVTCTSAGNPYATGISYNTNNTPINVTLQQGPPGVQVIANGGVVNAVNLNSTFAPATGGPATLTANDATITHIIANGPNQSALHIQAAGSATITASGIINVTGTNSTNAIFATVFSSVAGAVASVNYNGLATPGITDINVIGGPNSTAIQACANDGCGFGNAVDANVIINAGGNLTGIGPLNAPPSIGNGIAGLFAASGGNGDATVNYHRGTIDVSGTFANGIFAAGVAATVTTDPGTTIIVRSPNGEELKPGIAIDAFGGAGTATVASTIQMLGPAAPDPAFRNNGFGIRATGSFGSPISVNYTGPGITTEGGNGIGIAALSPFFGGFFGGPITVLASGPISTSGDAAHGIWASTTGTVQVDASKISTTGQFSSGIYANSTAGGAVVVNIASGGSVNGGWQTGASGVGPLIDFGPSLPAAGVILNSTGGTATLNNFGSIGALSDRAVAGSPLGSNGNAIINNSGIITGFVQFNNSSGNNSILNTGTFNLRHFAQTTPNGGRDTLRVAIADLGTGPNNIFTNNGTLALPALPAVPTTLVNTGQYLPLDNPNNAMAVGGPLQGHLIGVSTFNNSGTIDLQSNPAAGDVLVITGARQAGTAGPGTFISNGGTLRLDTVLNEGGPATRSDTLVVDGTLVGAGGATGMAIRNAGGTPALTVNDGILVVQVLNPARSASGAFSLNGGFIRAGAFDYFLFKGGFSPGSQGNWYLRNTIVPGPEPAPGPPLPTPVPGAAPIPLFQPEVALKSVVPFVARTLGLVTLGTFNERQGDQLLLRGDMKVGAWGRVFGQHTREQFAQGARPDFEGTFAGFQAGADLLRLESINGHSDHFGFYIAQARASGGVHGLVDGFEGALAGHIDLDATSYAGYWTHLGPTNWYIDAVLQWTYIQGSPMSIGGVPNNIRGSGWAGSLEAGYPIALTSWLTFEPQIQGIWQRVSIDDTQDPFSTITFDRADVFTGRAGALLRGSFGSTGAVWQPYLKGNVWWGSNGSDTVTFNSFGIPTGRNGGATLEGGGGVTGKLTRNVSVYGDASYLSSVSGESRITLKGNVGMRVTW